VVELRITSERKRKYISTGVKVLPKQWKNGSVVGREDWQELNERLRVLYKKCSEVISQMLDEGCFELDAVPDKLAGSMRQRMTFLEFAKEVADARCKRVTMGTREHYGRILKFLEEWKGIVHFADLTERKILDMDEELKKRGLKECTRWNYHKFIKMFCRHALDEGLIRRNPYARLTEIKRGNESGLTRYLEPKEFHRFERCEIQSKRLERVRDLFVFQTYTMMGYSDLERFDYKACVKMDGQMVYKSRRKKTNQEFTVMLLPQALNILKKYKYKLPIISLVKYNAYLKNAVLCAKIDKNVTSHWARHTGATLLLNEGQIPLQVIQHILGHSSIRETEKTYAKLLDRTIVEKMKSYNA
jgi:integrase